LSETGGDNYSDAGGNEKPRSVPKSKVERTPWLLKTPGAPPADRHGPTSRVVHLLFTGPRIVVATASP
jgi:hypothetical protein